MKVLAEILCSRHEADLTAGESSGFIHLKVLITLNPPDRSRVDKSHLNQDCSKGAATISHTSLEQSTRRKRQHFQRTQFRPRLN